MSCLTDVELQMIVDNEQTGNQAHDAPRLHLAGCSLCRTRVEERRRQMDDLASLVQSEGDMPPALAARVRDTLESARPVRGATSLRGPLQDSWHRVGWLSALATAGVIALVMFGVLPHLGAPTGLSAAEILGRSLQTLSGTHGIELIEYELEVAGLSQGPHHIEQLVDHEHPSRYRLSNRGSDGMLESAISQDPFTGRRSQLIRVDGRNYIFNFASAKPILSLPQMAQAHVEAVITMMQATSDPKLSIVDTPEGQEYIIQIPQVAPKSGAGMFDLYHARAVIDAHDFRLKQFDASGALLKQPYTVAVRLIRQVLRPPAEVSPAEFEIEAGPGDVVLEGEATNDPLGDLLGTVLRELGRLKGA
jgi:hypothetical protein